VSGYIRDATNNRRQILVHCNGDAAADQLLSIYMGIFNEKPEIGKADLRPVMLHCQTVRDNQLDLMKKLGMIPSIFIDHTYYWGDVHMENLGDFRGSRISPAASALDKGLKMTLHQDSPTVRPDMLHTVWTAVNRISRSGETIGEKQRISVYQALEAVTKNAAYQYHEEDLKGTIGAGKLADLVILDKNPLSVEEDQIKNIKVVETIKEGETIFRAY
jgi:hypothetical protein